MNLGALIYDSSKDSGPMYVYRMQKWDPVNKLMAGPYTYSSLINASWNTDSDSAQPDPDYDFPPEDLETEEFKSADVRFGFLHPEDAKRWFGSGFEKLISVGFSMHKIPASKVWLSKSQRQVIFVPDFSTPEGRQLVSPEQLKDHSVEIDFNKRYGIERFVGKVYQKNSTVASVVMKLYDKKESPWTTRKVGIISDVYFLKGHEQDLLELYKGMLQKAREHGLHAVQVEIWDVVRYDLLESIGFKNNGQGDYVYVIKDS